MRLLRPTETGRGSEGRISHEAIKADIPLSTVVNRESEIHAKFGKSDPLPVSVGLNAQKACWA